MNLSPLGAYRLLRMPMREIAARVVSLSDVFGVGGQRLIEQLGNTKDWATRFSLVDQFFLNRFQRSEAISPGVEYAWRRLTASRGRVPTRELAVEAGWSRQHLAQRFQIEVGQSPKTVARILRFEHAQAVAASRTVVSWTSIALDCGFADQAHLIREYRSLSGLTPRELHRRTDPLGGGVLEHS